MSLVVDRQPLQPRNFVLQISGDNYLFKLQEIKLSQLLSIKTLEKNYPLQIRDCINHAKPMARLDAIIVAFNKKNGKYLIDANVREFSSSHYKDFPRVEKLEAHLKLQSSLGQIEFDDVAFDLGRR